MSGYPELNERTRGWLRHLWKKATTPDDWSRGGAPHAWWDQYSTPPMLNFARFDLSESSYALALMADATPAWREVYGRILDEMIERHTTFWAAVDWLTLLGHDPNRSEYPEEWRGSLVPEHLWGEYDAPGWTANGVEPWGLQADPIGSDGNLFFRGFLNLMLGIRRYVADDDRWDRPFQMTGLEDQTFEWTHPRIAEFLSNQWAERPEGPHCENTKIWPYCLSAAGLGLQLGDRVRSTSHHWVFGRWVEDFVRKKLMATTPDGRLEWMALYYDPLIDHLQAPSPIAAIAPCLYVVPQDPALAEIMYEAGVGALGWNDPRQVLISPPDPRFVALGLVLAQELGDRLTEVRLRDTVERWYEPRFFGEDGDEFGWWFLLNEEHPRGQLSALLMMAELGSEGAWWRVFNEPNLDKFSEPTVTGVDYPTLGLSQAWNDLDHGLLKLSTYAATSSRRGAETSFRVEKLPGPKAAVVRRDGDPWDRWRVTGEDSIEIETDVGAHSFQIFTGATAAAAGAGDGRRSRGRRRSNGDGVARARGSADVGAEAVRQARRHLVSGLGTCPCCVSA